MPFVLLDAVEPSSVLGKRATLFIVAIEGGDGVAFIVIARVMKETGKRNKQYDVTKSVKALKEKKR